MKRIIPAIIAIVLIILVIGGSFGLKMLEKYSYSDEKQNLEEYYNISANDQIAIVLQNEHIEQQAKLIDGYCYMTITDVQTLLNKRFYYDSNEGLLLFTTPTQIISNVVGASAYSVDGEVIDTDYVVSMVVDDTLYVAMDYVRQFTNFNYEYMTDPNRIQLRTQWGERTSAFIKKDTNLRVKGGVKSAILRSLPKGESVVVLEEMETWTKVKTNDAFIGYVENKFLKGQMVEEEIAASHYEEPEYTSIQRDYKINLGWHDVEVASANSTFDEFVNGTGTMNVISPTWFTITNNDGSISSIASREYVDKAHARNMEVWALIDNFSKDVDTHEVLSYTSKRTFIIDTLMQAVKDYNLDGINVDFETLDYSTGPHFVQFLRELSVACRLNGVVLSVDNYVPRESSAHYDREEQGIIADYVIIMGYDEHWGGGGVAGSVASIGFVEDGIARTVEEVPAHKVINALPFYTRVWKTKGGDVTSEALGMEATQNFINNYSVPVVWDEAACQNYGEKEMSGVLYQVWIEDAKSIETKLTIMKKYELGGVAAWKLGLEDKAIWDVIDAFVKS